MKTKYSIVIALIVVAIMSLYNVCNVQNINVLSNLALANVEALAFDEVSDGYETVYTPTPDDPNYDSVKCVCYGDGEAECC